MANQILYGFHNLQDFKNRRVTDVGVEVVNQEIDRAMAQAEADLNAMLDFFVVKTTDYSKRILVGSGSRNQPLDNNGRARPVKPLGYYDIGLPLIESGNAWGHTYVAGKKMTVAEAELVTNMMIVGDFSWISDHIIAALAKNASYTFNDDLKGQLTVKGLANNDTDKYSLFGNAGNLTTAQHYLAQANAIDDGADNPFPTIYNTLMNRPANAGEVVAFVPTNLVASIEGLATFNPVADPNLQTGANQSVLVGTLSGTLPGRLIGYVDKVWIVEWRRLPDNYIFATTTQGEKAIAMREDEEADLRGFKEVAERNDHPWYERQYLRRAGFGAWNRVGALVYRIGNASYAIPAGYETPMP